MTIHTVPAPRSRQAFLLTVVLVVMLLLAGCSSGDTGGGSTLKETAAQCPGTPVDALVLTDGSGSGDSAQITQERLATIEKVATRVVLCTGTLSVRAFSSSSGATVTIYESDLTLTAPTVNARIRQAPEAVEAVMKEIAAAYGPAIAGLPQGGSDISSTLRLFGEQAAQFPEHFHDYWLLTDGAQNLGPVQITGPLTPEAAQTLADTVPVPILPAESSLTVAGIGHVAGDPIPSDVVEGMVSFYTALIARTGAGSTLVVTTVAG